VEVTIIVVRISLKRQLLVKKHDNEKMVEGTADVRGEAIC
jgi:hypothetical protein